MLFRSLQAEGYAGAYDSVQRHVRQWKIEAGRGASTKAFVPLFFASGDVAQFDRSYEHVVLGGTTTMIKLAHFRLAYSRQMFVVACPASPKRLSATQSCYSNSPLSNWAALLPPLPSRRSSAP